MARECFLLLIGAADAEYAGRVGESGGEFAV